MVDRLLQRDPNLWLSRSWTTRPPRAGEAPDAYVFVDRPSFLAHRDAGGFLEWTELPANRHLYGTPRPDPPAGTDVVLDIDLDGVRQVKRLLPETVAILIEPPSIDALAERMRMRGDTEEQIRRRLDLAEVELAEGPEVADEVVVNDDLNRAVDQVARILVSRRNRTGDH